MRPPISFRRWALALAAVLVFFVGKPSAREPDAPAEATAGDATQAAEAAPPDAGAPPDAAAPEEAEKTYDKPEKVTVGVYLNDIQAIDLKTHSYAVDAYVWFRWKNPDLDPATAMEFVNPYESWGHILTPNYEEPRVLANGDLYQVVRFTGRFSQKLPLYNYPFDKQTLTIGFEDSVEDGAGLVYVPDGAGVTVNPKMVLPGYEIDAPVLTLSSQTYPTNFGDADSPAPSTYSRATVEIPIHRPPVAYATKLLLPVLCVIVCAALMFLLAPSYVDARVDVGITALLTIVALQMTFNQDVPDVGYLMLMDKIYLCAYLFVIAGLGIGVRSTRMFDAGNAAEAARLHRTSLSGLIAVWTLAMVVLVGQAMSAG